MSINDPEYSPNAEVHAVRHLDVAEEWTDMMHEQNRQGEYVAKVDALIGIGWALIAIARKR